MTPYKSHEKKALLYAINDTDGTPLAKDLSGAMFNYTRFVKQQERFLGEYIRIYHQNLSGKVYTPSGSAFHVADRELSPEEELIDMLRQFHNHR